MLVESLRRQLTNRGYQVDVVSLPFKWYPKEEIIKHALAWRLLDLTESNGRPIDLVIATKFPSYLVRHPRKVTWLVHQFRQAYDLYGTAFGDLGHTEEDLRIVELVRRMDGVGLGESRAVYTIADNVSRRLAQNNAIAGSTLYPPPPLERAYRCSQYGDYILSVGRLEPIKRVDLLIKAMAHIKGDLRCVIAGDGPDRERLEAIVHDFSKAYPGRDLENRIQFMGYVSDDTLVDLYANCFSVFYAPYDEDYGYVTLEAFMSQKPVVTTHDSGGVLEFVRDGVTGVVALPDPESIASKIEELYSRRDACAAFGAAGYESVKAITWDKTIDALLSSAL
ncbi:MAG: hypothetical protein HW403_978 [Dehalococcoidia bacterium]|nr:hypothetical protein [Dehalococcoidia bacterium]